MNPYDELRVEIDRIAELLAENRQLRAALEHAESMLRRLDSDCAEGGPDAVRRWVL